MVNKWGLIHTAQQVFLDGMFFEVRNGKCTSGRFLLRGSHVYECS